MSSSDEFPDVDSDSIYQSIRNIENEAKDIVKNLLLSKSAVKCNLCNEELIKWMDINKTKSFSEEVLRVYFIELSEELKPSILCSRWSMLKTVIKLNQEINIDQYQKLKQFMKNKSKGFKSKKAQVFSLAQVKTFIDQGPDHV